MAQPITSVPMTSGQEKQLVRFVADAAESAAKRVVADADFLWKDGAQLIIERGGELRTAIERATLNALKQLSSRYPVLTETRLLKPVAQATVLARTRPFNVAEFYQTIPGAYIRSKRFFVDRLDLSTKPMVDSAPERPYVASLLKANAFDAEIRKELPENHLSTLEDIASLIEAQPVGKPGLLLANGHANIFYVAGKNAEVFAADISLDPKSGWSIDICKLNNLGYWFSGLQVLCPGTAAL